MLKFLFKKEHRLQNLIAEYLETIEQIRHHFEEAIAFCKLKPNCDQFDYLRERTHKYESRADDIHDEINNLMYGKALIPESRGDIMELLEMIETIPRVFERILLMIQTQRVTVPAFLHLDFEELIRISMNCCDLLKKQVAALLQKHEGIRAALNAIDANESHCDHIQRRMVIKLFDSDTRDFDKLQVRDLIERVGEISDRTLWVARRVNIMSMTRRV